MSETKIIHRSNYLIYVDNVRVDQFVTNWSANTSLSANDTRASITFFRSPHMDEWKAYLSKVKIFAENPFTKKYSLVFEGDITSRTWNDKKSNMGTVTFHCSGFYHWLDIDIPMSISTTDEMNPLQRFIYEAQNINIEEVRSLVTSDSDVLLKDNNVQGVINQLFEKITAGYYGAAEENTNFAFSSIKERFVILSDVKKEFRESGFLDLFTFSKASFIDSFSSFLTEVTEQLMMEFYQDRDGTFKIKFPAWGEDVLKSHVLDTTIVESVSGANEWSSEPTRVLAVGSATQLQKAMYDLGGTTSELIHDLTIPVGLYIGDPRKPETEEYHSATLELQFNDGAGGGSGSEVPLDGTNGVVEGFAGSDVISKPNVISTREWFDNLGSYPVTGPFQQRSKGFHYGTDYGTKYDPIYNIGTKGVVVSVGGTDTGKTMGNNITIGQNIEGKYYEFKYMHLKEKPNLRPGQTIYPGQFIAHSGATGGAYSASLSSAMRPHLHLEIWRDKWYKKPYMSYVQNPDKFLRNMRSKFKDSPKVTPGEGIPLGKGAVSPGPTASGSNQSYSQGTGGAGKYLNYKGHPSWKPAQSAIAGPESREYDAKFTLDYGTKSANLDAKLKGALAGKGMMFYKAGKEIGIDPAFIAAVAIHESGNGSSNGVKTKNNPFGVMDPKSGWSKIKYFNSIEEAVRVGFYEMTIKKFVKKNIITPRLLQPYYAPYGAANDKSGLNKHWVPNVTRTWLSMRGDNPQPLEMSAGGSSSPNASTGGRRGFGLVNYPTGFSQVTDLMNKSRLNHLYGSSIEKPMKYNDSLKADYPLYGRHLSQIIDSYSGKIAPALIASIINTTSRWSSSYSTKNSIGVTAVNRKFLNKKEEEKYVLQSGSYAVAKAVQSLTYARSFYFGGAIVPTIAYYFSDNPGAFYKEYINSGKNMMSLIKKGGPHIKKMQAVVDDMLKGGFTYLEGEFHKDMTGKLFLVNGLPKVLNADGSYSDFDEVTDSMMVPGEENGSNFIPRLSEEEKEYKINLVQVEQELIRMDSAAISSATNVEESGGESVAGNDNSGKVVDSDKMVDSDASRPTKKPNDDHITPLPLHDIPTRSVTRRSASDIIKKSKTLLNEERPELYKGNRMNTRSGLGIHIVDDVLKNPYAGSVVGSEMIQNLKDKQSNKNKPPTIKLPDPNADNVNKNQDLDNAPDSENQVIGDVIDVLEDKNMPDYSKEIDELIYQYAKYNMQLHRATAHSISVNLTLCLPHLRVGTNIWLEPTRTDLVFYSTGVSHSGSFSSGCKTEVTGAFLRDTETYKDVPENIFIGEKKADSSAFGETVKPSDLKKIRNDLNAMHSKGFITSAHKMTTLTKLYSAHKDNPKYGTKWNTEKTIDEIDLMIKEEYDKAPDIIKSKIKKTNEAISKSVEIFIEKLHANFFKK